ncbi:unnamed protein product [Musa acuminata subsp. burmannicoides]
MVWLPSRAASFHSVIMQEEEIVPTRNKGDGLNERSIRSQVEEAGPSPTQYSNPLKFSRCLPLLELGPMASSYSSFLIVISLSQLLSSL